MKKIVILMGLLIIFLTLVLFLVPADKDDKKSDKLTIVTTLFPSYDFAKNIAGKQANVTLLLPPSVEPHSFEPKPSDIVKINQADLFVYTGQFMEPWAQDVIEGIDKKVKVVDTSKGIDLMKEEDDHEYEHEYEHEAETHQEENVHHDEEHHHGGVDPHIWLDYDNAKIMAENITKALIEVDSENKQYYLNNFEVYQSALVDLDKVYKKTLSACKTKKIIYGGHYALGYLAKRYDLEYISAQGFSPDSEPTARDLIALVEQVKKDNISYIFYEELSSPKIAETLARETGAKLLILNAAHNPGKEDYRAGITYISIMKKNLKNLRLGLGCK